MPHLTKIDIYPFKSCDPQSVERAVLLPSGALEHDRRFALMDGTGQIINAKRMPSIHRLRTEFDTAKNRLSLRIEDSNETSEFDVEGQRRELGAWLGEFFGMPVEIVENRVTGFPDDTESPGPTVISAATFAEVAGWFAAINPSEARARFRANLEIDGVEAFWEDRLVAEGSRVVRFQIGEAQLLGTNPCQRCPVPTRNPWSGEATREFAKVFASRRESALPSWAPVDKFDHFYRLAVNTRPAVAERQLLQIGDEVRILGVI